jgi:hypothetical protein
MEVSIGKLLRVATECPSQHDCKFLLELGYELERRLQHPKGPHYEGCPACSGLNKILQELKKLSAGIVPSAAVLDAIAAEVHRDGAE